MDWPLLFAAVLLLLFGLTSLYSVVDGFRSFFEKQLINVAIGIVPFAIGAFVNPNWWRRGASWLYFLDLVMLLAIFKLGVSKNGSERWIPLPGGIQFQPSEFAKLLTILTLSAFYANRQDRIQQASTFFLGFLHVAIPMVLIWKQPHLGAALVVLVMWFAVSLVAGVRMRFLIGFVVFAALLGTLALKVPAIQSHLMADYQMKRVNGLERANAKGAKDIRGKNWQTDRAEIAIGVGGVLGTGFMRGEQKQAGFIPEQYNDFIVTVIGEEGGLVGCTLLLCAYGFFFYRVFLIILETTEYNYKLIAAGIFAVLGFHTFVNMAMVLQMLPVVGLWLPFLSYGGTAIWLCMACVGVLLGIRRRQRPLLF